MDVPTPVLGLPAGSQSWQREVEPVATVLAVQSSSQGLYLGSAPWHKSYPKHFLLVEARLCLHSHAEALSWLERCSAASALPRPGLASMVRRVVRSCPAPRCLRSRQNWSH